MVTKRKPAALTPSRKPFPQRVIGEAFDLQSRHLDARQVAVKADPVLGEAEPGDDLLGGRDLFEPDDRDRGAGRKARRQTGQLGLFGGRQTEASRVLADRSLVEAELDKGRATRPPPPPPIARPVVGEVVGVEAVDDDRQIQLAWATRSQME